MALVQRFLRTAPNRCGGIAALAESFQWPAHLRSSSRRATHSGDRTLGRRHCLSAAGFVLLANSGLAPPVRADALADASAAYAAGRYPEARALWLQLAQKASAEAAYRLGLLADLGQGVPASATVAYGWYRRAATAGNAAAEFNVAVMEDSGRGTVHDAADASIWYARAAARGNRRAQYDLALLYDAGDGVPRNPDLARAWFRLAAAGGLPAATEKLDAPRAAARLPLDAKPSSALRPAVPLAPPAGFIETNADATTEIVWSAPPQSSPVQYFLQVVARGDGPEREVHAGYLDVSASLVRLDASRHRYFWRVFTVSRQNARYTASPWTGFTTPGSA